MSNRRKSVGNTGFSDGLGGVQNEHAHNKPGAQRQRRNGTDLRDPAESEAERERKAGETGKANRRGA